MQLMLFVHILAGSLGLLSGYVALYASKGAAVHRKSGLVFVCVMLTMATTGFLISAIEGVAPAINIPTALLVFYLVVTALTTVRPLPVPRAFDAAGMAFFLGQADVFPRPIRIRPLLALPVLTVLASMFFWLWRTRARRMASPRAAQGLKERVEDALAFNPKEQTS
jgi:hypothetical protein